LYQRATRGWADCDTWNFDDYLTRVASEGIVYLAEHLHSHPSKATADGWKNTLLELAEDLRESREGYDIRPMERAWRKLARYICYLWD
jgi:hypothetical protein